MLKAFPRTPFLTSLRASGGRASSSSAPSTPTVHDAQSTPKATLAREVAAQHGAALLLQKALTATDKALREQAHPVRAPRPTDRRATFVSRPREDADTRATPLPNAGGRWTVAADTNTSAPPASADGTPAKSTPGYRAVAHQNIAGGLLAHRRKRGIADDFLVRDILRNKAAPAAQQDRDAREWYATPIAERQGARPSRGAPRGDRTASASAPQQQHGGPRKPREQGGPKRPFGNKRAATAPRDPFAHLPELKYPTKVHYPTLDVAALIRSDLATRALRLKAAVATPSPADPTQAQRLAAHLEHQGDYTRWFADASTGPEAVRQARQSLATNPSFGLVEREALLKAVREALPGKTARR